MDGTYNQANVTGTSSSCSAPEIIPNRNSPRILSSSQFCLAQRSDGNLVYDSPEETDQYLHKKQGSAYPNFQGTCGLCSCANILRLAGVCATEAQMITYAAATENPFAPPFAVANKLCATGFPNSGINGGTSPRTRQLILKHFGVNSFLENILLENDGSLSSKNLALISDYVCSGRGVILSVHAKVLWRNVAVGDNDFHAVTVTSVKKDVSGNILGFYICDSANNGTTYYSSSHLLRALTGSPMNVTQCVIR